MSVDPLLLGCLALRDDRRQMFKLPTEIGALPGGIFNHRSNTLCFIIVKIFLHCLSPSWIFLALAYTPQPYP